MRCGQPSATEAITQGIQGADPNTAEPKKETDLLPWTSLCLWVGPVFIDLIHVSNKESHKTAADQRHGRGRDHHDDAPSLVDQKAQATSNQDLSQLYHAGEDGAVQALPSPAAIPAPSWGLVSLQGKHRNTLNLHERSFRAEVGTPFL